MLRGYLVALVCVVVAVVLTIGILQTPGFRAAIPYAFLFAVVIPAWIGYGPGLFATFLTFFAAPLVFEPHLTALKKDDPNQVVLTVLVCVLVSRVSQSRKGAEHALRKANEELEARVRERTAALERSNAELEQFAYVASHDLQEPLRMVGSFAGLLTRRYEGKLDGDADEFLAHIQDGVRRMQALIGDLLAYSRVAGEESRQSATVQVRTELQDAIKACQLAIESSGAVVTWDELPEVRVNARQLNQVLQNLITNAIKYRKEEESPRIHVSASWRNGEWVFAVADNGTGIPPEYHERVFGLFKRLHGPSVPGTGIGLAICRKIVEQHHGRIWVESSPGAGATFYFTLPAGV